MFYVILLFSFINIENVLSNFHSNGFQQPNYGHENQYQRHHPNLNQDQHFKRNDAAPVECENGATGLYAHPSNCAKFLKCDCGRTFIEQCGPGTVFNDVLKVCDWPQSVDCGARNANARNTASKTNYPNYGQQSHYDEAIQFVDSDWRDSVVPLSQHNQHQYPHHYHHHHEPHHPNYNHQPPHSYNPSHHHHHHDHWQHQHDNNQYRPVDNSQIPQPHVPFAPIPSEASQTLNIPTLPQDLLPPVRKSTLTSDDVPLNKQSNPHDNIQDRLETNQMSGLSTAAATGAFPYQQQATVLNFQPTNEAAQPELSSHHNIVPPNSIKAQDNTKTASLFSELNYMTSQVGDEFNKYFSNPKPKSTPTNHDDSLKPGSDHVSPQLIRPQNVQITPDQMQSLNQMTSRVFDEFHKQFESPKPQLLPETQSQQLPNNETDPNHVPMADRSNLVDDELFYDNVQSSRFPGLNLMMSRVANEFNKHFSGPFQFETPKSIINDENQTKLHELPKDTRPDPPQIIASSSNFGVPSQGGDTTPQGFGNENIQNRAIVVTGKNGLFHTEPALNGRKTRNSAPIVTSIPNHPVASTTTKVFAISISSTEEQTTFPITTTKSKSPLEMYNKFYYQPHKSLLNETKQRDEFDDIPISENLKQLLRLYSNKKPSNVNGSKLNQTNSLESQKSTKNMTAIVDNRNLQDTPITIIRPIKPNDNKSNRPRQNRPRLQSGNRNSPESNIYRNPQLSEPTQQPYYREGAYHPNQIYFPAAHSQSHAMNIRQ